MAIQYRHQDAAKDALVPPFSRSVELASDNELSVPSKNIINGPLSSFPLEYDTLLPAMYFAGVDTTLIPEDDIPKFLNYDLDVARLNYIHERLWLAGRAMNYKPLHRQKMMNRQIIITEQTDLHLTWANSTIFIKPFPRYLGNYEFWIAHLCGNKTLHEKACGFLFSYTWLITYESDFHLALEMNLLPQISWTQWRAYVQSARKVMDMDLPNGINQRYQYGELRLQRLEWIHRFWGRPQHGSFVRGYYSNYHTYRSFFVQNVAWVFGAFVFVTIILTAMQVGLATEHLQSSERFQAASYGFAIFAMIALVTVIGVVAMFFFSLFFYNLVITLIYRREREKKWSGREKA